MKIRSLLLGFGAVVFIAVLAILFVRFTGVGATTIYKNTGWDLTGNAPQKYEEEIHKESDALMQKLSAMPVTTFELDSPEYNFGTIPDHKTASHLYTIKNTGANPLVIGDVKVGCGCTLADFTQSPIPPNGTGKIEIEFDPTGKEGHQQKNLMIYANTIDSPYPFFFTAYVTKH